MATPYSIRILPSRQEFVDEVVNLLDTCEREALLMGRHVAWIRDEGAFHSAVERATKRGVSIRVISYKPQTR
ncbi:MAG: hypothetical protein L3K17_02220, partial [Thermoplasmata archaeon]|nr:hypothetical protein [Thermoplasmata archaeon]